MAKATIVKFQEMPLRGVEVKEGATIADLLKANEVEIVDESGSSVDIGDLSEEQLAEIDLRVNDQPAKFTDLVKDGDVITLVPEVSGGN
jgi:molybdopterin converting factor small subunit